MQKIIYTFGGSDPSELTAEYLCKDKFYSYDGNKNGAGWKDLTPLDGPAGRAQHSAVLVSLYNVFQSQVKLKINDMMILFGGTCEVTSDTFSDTWFYNITSNSWNQTILQNSPTPRFSASMAATASSQYVILYGGISADGSVLGDTWVLDLTNQENPMWEEVSLTTAVSPPGTTLFLEVAYGLLAALYGAVMARNNATNTVYLFSGCQEKDLSTGLCSKSDSTVYSLSISSC